MRCIRSFADDGGAMLGNFSTLKKVFLTAMPFFIPSMGGYLMAATLTGNYSKITHNGKLLEHTVLFAFTSAIGELLYLERS